MRPHKPARPLFVFFYMRDPFHFLRIQMDGYFHSENEDIFSRMLLPEGGSLGVFRCRYVGLKKGSTTKRIRQEREALSRHLTTAPVPFSLYLTMYEMLY